MAPHTSNPTSSPAGEESSSASPEIIERALASLADDSLDGSPALPDTIPIVAEALTKLRRPPPVALQIDFLTMVEKLTAGSLDISIADKVIEMYREEQARLARRAYNDAMAAFRSVVPILKKDRRVHFEASHEDAEDVDYRHTSLGFGMAVSGPILGTLGLNPSWRLVQENGGVTVRAIVTHVDGHEESTSLSAPPDTGGKKSPVQATMSTITSLRRATMFPLLGLASADEDDDGRASGLCGPTASAAPPAGDIVSLEESRCLETMLDALDMLKPGTREAARRHYANSLTVDTGAPFGLVVPREKFSVINAELRRKLEGIASERREAEAMAAAEAKTASSPPPSADPGAPARAA